MKNTQIMTENFWERFSIVFEFRQSFIHQLTKFPIASKYLQEKRSHTVATKALHAREKSVISMEYLARGNTNMPIPFLADIAAWFPLHAFEGYPKVLRPNFKTNDCFQIQISYKYLFFNRRFFQFATFSYGNYFCEPQLFPPFCFLINVFNQI